MWFPGRMGSSDHAVPREHAAGQQSLGEAARGALSPGRHLPVEKYHPAVVADIPVHDRPAERGGTHVSANSKILCPFQYEASSSPGGEAEGSPVAFSEGFCPEIGSKAGETLPVERNHSLSGLFLPPGTFSDLPVAAPPSARSPVTVSPLRPLLALGTSPCAFLVLLQSTS